MNATVTIPQLHTLPSIKTQFVADVTFGIPRKNCQNYGICRINPFGGQARHCSDCYQHVAQALVTVYGHHYVEFDFLRQSIKEADYQKYFASGRFRVDEDHRFSDPDDQFQFSISKGYHTIIENNSTIKVICH